jgi:hypothetical protein
MTRALLTLLLLALTAMPAWADVEVGAGKVLSAVDDCAVIALRDNQGAHVSFLANTLDGTVVAKVSLNGSAAVAGMVDSHFVHPTSGVISLSYIGSGSNVAADYGIASPTGATHAAVCASSVTSGTVHATMRASSKPPLGVVGSDGTNLRTVKTTSTGVVEISCVSGCAGSGGTSMTDDAAFTVGTTTFTPVGGTYKGTLDSVDDGDGGAFAMTVKRFLYTSIGTPAGDSAMDDTNDAVRTTPVTTVTVGGQSATDTTTAFTNCTTQVNKRFTTNETQVAITGVASKLSRICGIILLADGDTDVTISEGTGTTCGTGNSVLIGPLDLTSTNGRGFTAGFNNAVVVDGLANANDICIQNGSAVNLTVFLRYAIY